MAGQLDADLLRAQFRAGSQFQAVKDQCASKKLSQLHFPLGKTMSDNRGKGLTFEFAGSGAKPNGQGVVGGNNLSGLVENRGTGIEPLGIGKISSRSRVPSRVD